MARIVDPEAKKLYFFGIAHLKETQMDYFHHCKHGLVNGFYLIWLGITSIIHSFLPWVFKYHSAKGVIKINNDMKRFSHLHRLFTDCVVAKEKK